MSTVTSHLNPAPDTGTAKTLLLQGKVGEAISELKNLEKRAGSDHCLLQQIAELYVKCSQHELAGRCYQRSVRLQPGNPDYLYNLATSRTALGQLDEAESLFKDVIRLKPADHGAWLNLSSLKKWTMKNNHLEELKSLRSQLAQDHPGRISISYALAKELEDLQLYDDSFIALQEGAVHRRRNLQYDVQEDVDAMSMVATAFNRQQLGSESGRQPPDRPVFILGLPRSGTTLVDRIVSSHSQVNSLGEHNMLAISLMLEIGLDGSLSKEELIRQSTAIDFVGLGQRYLSSIEGFGSQAARLVDKTPLNFLYIGLIHKAFPNARIIHLRRNPMDSCYAMYKTLFRAGYPFSYRLQDIGRYYIAYHRLMEHWRTCIPAAFLDVDYERLVSDQEVETRRILRYLDLPWEESCMQFHRHSGAAATASAAQVRQPIYSSSVDIWQHYARQLAPFERKLREQGIDTA